MKNDNSIDKSKMKLSDWGGILFGVVISAPVLAVLLCIPAALCFCIATIWKFLGGYH